MKYKYMDNHIKLYFNHPMAELIWGIRGGNNQNLSFTKFPAKSTKKQYEEILNMHQNNNYLEIIKKFEINILLQ
jgi:hypothetical protein